MGLIFGEASKIGLLGFKDIKMYWFSGKWSSAVSP
jgi:hypothetical protein